MVNHTYYNIYTWSLPQASYVRPGLKKNVKDLFMLLRTFLQYSCLAQNKDLRETP